MSEVFAVQEGQRRRSESASRPPSSLQARANNIVKRLGNLTGRLGKRAQADKSQDTRERTGGSPYRQTQSMDTHRKPFASQPMLALHPEQSPSPGNSSFGTSTPSFDYYSQRRSSSRDGHSHPARGLPGPSITETAASAHGSDTGRTRNLHTGPGWVHTGDEAPNILVSEPGLSTPPSSWRSGRHSVDHGESPGLKTSDLTSGHNATLGGAVVSEPLAMNTSSPECPENTQKGNNSSQSLRSSSAPFPSSPTGSLNANALNAKEGSHEGGTSMHRLHAPRLVSLPPLSAASFADTPEQRARLSPSIITRAPPLPILHLPTLPIPTPSTSTPRPQAMSRLMSMPMLPREGADDRENDPDHEHSGLGDTDEEYEDDEDVAGQGASVDHSPGSDDEAVLTDEGASSTVSQSQRSQFVGLTNLNIPKPDLFLHPTTPGLETLTTSVTPIQSSYVPSATPGVAEKHQEREDATPKETTQSRDYFFAEPSTRHEAHSAPRIPEDSNAIQGAPSAERTLKSEIGPSNLASTSASSAQSHIPPLPSPRPSLYHQASRSMVNLLSSHGEGVSSASFNSRVGGGVDSKGKGKASETPLLLNVPPHVQSTSRKSDAEAYLTTAQQDPHTPLRRRSMPTFHKSGPPPPYPEFIGHPNNPHSKRFSPMPRDDEGKECLPGYSNDVHLVAIMPRKLEFRSPGVQAKDRKWRRVLCVLEGTVFRVYACSSRVSGVSKVGEWWEKKVGVGDVSLVGGNFGTAGSGAGGAAGLIVRDPAAEPMRPVKWEEEERAAATANTANTPKSVILERTKPSPQPLQQTANRSKKRIAASFLHPSRAYHSSSSSMSSPAPTRPSTDSRSPSPFSNTPRSSLQLSRPPSRLSVSGSSAVISTSASMPVSAQSSTTCVATSTPPPTRSLLLHPRSRPMSESAPVLLEPNPKDLIREYSLQNAESGLASDYLKRKNVIRVRMEGEQFLLQTVDIADVIEWIEGLQAAANIALDLDERPMPKGPIFPRRRRRRRVRPPEEGAVVGPRSPPATS